MLYKPLLIVGTATTLIVSTSALPAAQQALARRVNILQGNDDGWAEANIRQLYFDLQSMGHNTMISSPAYDQSGRGSLDMPLERIVPVLLRPAHYGSVPAFKPSIGHNATDSRLNYVASFPVTAMRHGLQNLALPILGCNPDIVVSGPNVGSNIGSKDQFSGTLGVAAAAAVSFGIPAIAFSGAHSTKRPYTELQPGDVSHLYSALSMKVLSQILASGAPYLPANTFLNVNFPMPSTECTAVPQYKFILTTSRPLPSDKAITCDGTTIPDEVTVAATGCSVSITAMTAETMLKIKSDVSVDVQDEVRAKLAPLLSCYTT